MAKLSPLGVVWERDPEVDADEALRKAFEIIFNDRYLTPRVAFDESRNQSHYESEGKEVVFPEEQLREK